MSKPGLLALFTLLGVSIGLGITFFAPNAHHKTVTYQSVEWLDKPRTLEQFTLDTPTGKFDNESLKGKWTVVLFGFLSCPDVCPTSMSQLATLADQLPDVNYVFVSIDPDRDQVSNVQSYAQRFHPAMTGVTGSKQELMQFATSLGIQFTAAADNETIAHSVTFSIVDPEGVLRGRFRPGFDHSTVANQLSPSLRDLRKPS